MMVRNLAGFYLEQISDAVTDRQLAALSVDLKVGLARDYGCSWADIAAQLGVTRQAAWEKYGKGAYGGDISN